MDGIIEGFAPQMDLSAVAGRITSIVAERHERAVVARDEATAARYDISLDTIYFAALLLMIVNGSGQTRGREDVLGALATTGEIIEELRDWIEEGGA